MAGIELEGRGAELSRAIAALRAAAHTGQGTIILVTGEAGIGKTAMLQAIAEQATRQGFAAGFGKAEEMDQIAPGAPLLVALRSGSRPLLDSDGFNGLADLYGQHLWLVDRIATLLEELATRGPVLIAIDDAQWVDRLSRFALRILPGRLAGSPVVWLLTSREAHGPAIDELTSSAVDGVHVHRLELGPLAPGDIERMAVARLGELPTGRAYELLRGVGGNPFLTVQLLDGLAQEQAHGRMEGSVPTGLIISTRRRMAALPADVSELVQLAAVLGRPLPVEDAPRLATQRLRAGWLDQVVATGLMAESETRVTFRHDLVRESVYADLLPSHRRSLHRRCWHYLLTSGHGPIAAAPHVQASAERGDHEAVEVLRQAAAQSSPETAGDLLQKALRLLDPADRGRCEVGLEAVEALVRAQRPAEAIFTADHVLAETPNVDGKARIQLEIARALWPMGRLADMVRRIRETLALPNVSVNLRARLTAAEALTMTRAEPASVALAAARAALTEAVRLDDRPAEELATEVLGEVARNEGRHAEALTHFRHLRELAGTRYLGEEITALQLLDRYDEAEKLLAAARLSDTLPPSVLFAQMWQDFNLSRFDDAEADALTLVRLGDELGNHTYAIEGWMILSSISLSRGDLDKAYEYLARAERHSQAGDDVEMPGLVLMRGWLASARGDVAESVRILKPHLMSARESRSYWPWWPGWMRVFTQIGRAAGDAEFVAEAVALAAIGAERNPGVRSFAGLALQVRGVIDGDLAMLAEAVEILRAGPRPMLLASALVDHGFALLDVGQHREAVGQLGEAWHFFDKAGNKPALSALQRGLQAAGSRRKPGAATRARPVSGWGALTDSELRVARLIGAGRTNREAGAQLDLSPNTVATHLRAVFAKLGVRSRVQLANAMHTLNDSSDVSHDTAAGPLPELGR
ncbi:ATP-binding protein [Micromonospora coerulea]|uniref:ATP-binding protein n=1 Tax=Micromonospora coerulea TaxID=47856 RepID=UPI001902F766|nr:LuxR family transcriptional regulator [Micromonospora veneta]